MNVNVGISFNFKQPNEVLHAETRKLSWQPVRPLCLFPLMSTPFKDESAVLTTSVDIFARINTLDGVMLMYVA